MVTMTVLDKGGGDGKMVQTRPRQSWKKAGADVGQVIEVSAVLVRPCASGRKVL
jgi:hypothetical protein